jgi:hypothetical protein
VFEDNKELSDVSSERRIGKTIYVEKNQPIIENKPEAELFAISVKTISEHLQNIFDYKELDQNSVIRNFRTTASDFHSFQLFLMFISYTL